ncbi:hypothetical protein SAMN02927924_01003 [Sphingobium faniae]|nr:hypothetical protein SAMN02927924_01003 [Sphingobium faniae]
MGVWYMSMTDEKDGNSLKTQASRRRVPIHSELIQIGFLQFVGRQKQLGASARLFPTLKPNKYGNLAWYPVKRFNEQFLPAAMTLEERQSLYSLRHNVRDALRRVKAPAETLLAVTGWLPSGKAISDNYGDPGNPIIMPNMSRRSAIRGWICLSCMPLIPKVRMIASSIISHRIRSCRA